MHFHSVKVDSLFVFSNKAEASYCFSFDSFNLFRSSFIVKDTAAAIHATAIKISYEIMQPLLPRPVIK